MSVYGGTRNLSYNEITSFTDDLFAVTSLQKLYVPDLASFDHSWECSHLARYYDFRYLQGNKMNLTVSPSIFTAIQNLQDFKADPSIDTTCSQGDWQPTHGVKFCVLSNGTSTAGTHQFFCRYIK